MGAGMLPIAMGLGADPSFRSPMAVVVIGGLVTSTFLSLLVIPVVYSCVDDLLEWLRQRIGFGDAYREQHGSAPPVRGSVPPTSNVVVNPTSPRRSGEQP
jgi:hypothetical protein